MARHSGNIWECKITAHFTLREDTNLVLVELAKDKGLSKGKALEEILKTHPEFNAKKESLKKQGFLV
jgi:hypothetical protein